MQNVLLFLASCVLTAGFGCLFKQLGKSALIAWIVILSLLANLFVLKQISLFGFNATASDIFAIGSLLGLNMLQEQHGKKVAQQAIWISFSCLLFFVVFSQIHLLYVPSEHDTAHAAYESLLHTSPRILFASLITMLLVEQFDRYCYQQMRKKYPQRSLYLISGFTMAISQLLDTLLFSFFGLYGLVSALFEIILVAYAIKLIAIANTIPWTFITDRVVNKQYDKHTHNSSVTL